MRAEWMEGLAAAPEGLVKAVLEGMAAASFYICFFGRTRGFVLAGTGIAAAFLLAVWMPGLQQEAMLFSALWMMAVGYFRRAGEKQELFLAAGTWGMVCALAGLGADSISLQTAVAAALIGMTALYLLGRSRLYVLWMGILVCIWFLAGFFANLSYESMWKNWTMKAAVYLILGGTFAVQQIFCVRRELLWRYWTEESGDTVPSGEKGYEDRTIYWKEAAEQEYRRLRIFEHDFRHHLDVIGALYEAGCADEARDYLEDLKQARTSRQGRINGGERDLSYIMMAKREECRQAKIEFSCQIMGSPQGIARMDMTALLLNLLDNAIRACRKAPGPGSIGIMLLARGDLWQIELTNTGVYQPGERGRIEAEEKGAVHGIGLISVREIVEKYQGVFEIRQENNTVIQRLILTSQLPE